jgi:hypothetical protein
MILLFLIFVILCFHIIISTRRTEGIPVMFGTTEDAFGIVEPPITEITPAPSPEIPLILR